MYFIPYDEKSDINYIYLFYLYAIAEYNSENKLRNIIHYKNLQDIEQKINSIFAKNGNSCISKSTISRLLKDSKYNNYFSVDTKNKVIVLNNDYRKTNTNRKNKFVVVSQKQRDLIIEKQDNFFAKYSLFLIYYCGHSQSGKTDFTALQFLEACGYSTKSGNYVSKLCEFNRLLEERQIIKIDKYRDNNGNERNIYSLL